MRDHPLYQPGTGIPITRANIARINAERAERGQAPLTEASQVVNAFVPFFGARDHLPESYKRYTTRASNCLRPKGRPVAA